MFLSVRTFVIQSVSDESLSFSGARFLTVFGMTKGGVRNDKGGYLRPFVPFAKFAFGQTRHHTKKRANTDGSPLHGITINN